MSLTGDALVDLISEVWRNSDATREDWEAALDNVYGKREGHSEYGVKNEYGVVVNGPYPADPYLSAQDAFNDNGLDEAKGEKMMRRHVGEWEEIPDGTR